MKNYAFFFGATIFILILGIDTTMYLNGMRALGIFSFLGSLLVFASGMIWLIYRDDRGVYFRRPILFIPIAIFGGAVGLILKQVPLEIRPTAENLEEVGSLLMSRYQIGLWIVAIIIFFVFVMASSMLSGERQ